MTECLARDGFDEELERLEGRPVAEPCWRAKMWRRSYCVALYAIGVLEDRVRRLHREQWDTPMVFFYDNEQLK
jgi:hypothetical protein